MLRACNAALLSYGIVNTEVMMVERANKEEIEGRIVWNIGKQHICKEDLELANGRGFASVFWNSF